MPHYTINKQMAVLLWHGGGCGTIMTPEVIGAFFIRPLFKMKYQKNEVLVN